MSEPKETSAQSLQRQLVEMRRDLSLIQEQHAAVIRHLVSTEVSAATKHLHLTDEQLRYLREAVEAKAARKLMWADLAMHFVKWGLGGAVGFLAWSVWEAVKIKIGK